MNDDVRAAAAAISLAFVLFKTPERVPLLTKNHNQKDCIFVTVSVIQQAITSYFIEAASLSSSQSVTAVWIESLSRAISSRGQGS
jgi:hypothetical protein